MYVYRGQSRRQVGGGIWSTIQRGAKPFFHALLNKIKPHAIDVGKQLASSAIRVGSNLAFDNGQSLKDRLKSSIKDETTLLKGKAISALKRKCQDEEDIQTTINVNQLLRNKVNHHH